ncbi:MAG: hypothetical protein OS130_01155 [Thermodesulfobacteriota bacterium]|jgi:hypothetical protein|nr:MAG: hypothetical protein OS130_01155 [Thermodesulfobacteriota bacterium]
MKIKFILLALVLGLFFVVSTTNAGSVYHKYLMKGSVLEVSDSMAYICVGTKDGAKAGQELNVVRYVKTEATPGPKEQPMFKREEVGKLKIEKIVDEHMANAKIISGDVKVHDIVELKK